MIGLGVDRGGEQETLWRWGMRKRQQGPEKGNWTHKRGTTSCVLSGWFVENGDTACDEGQSMRLIGAIKQET